MRYDVIFLGGGPAGYEGAIRAGKKGLKIAVIENDKLGGTCLQRGCIPTKTLLHTVKGIKELKSLSKSGVQFGELSIDIDKINKQKVRVVSKLTKGVEFLFKQNNVELIEGYGKILDKNTVLINGEQRIEGKNIIIATGSSPAELPFLKTDDDLIINSDGALAVSSIPEKMLVVGAGAIGLEMATIYNQLGSEVIIVEMMDNIMPGSDTELTEILKKEMLKQKIKIHTGTIVSNPKKTGGNRISVDFKNKDDKDWQDEFNTILVAVGRKPNSEGIFDNSLNIELDKRGFIKVDKNFRTGEPNIYACGDVVGGALLAHKASHEAIAVIDHIIQGKDIENHRIPGAVFTFPEFASVGISEDEAKEKNIDIKIGKFPYSAGSRANAIDEKIGVVKIIADTNNTVLGAHIIGAQAGELLPILTLAVNRGMKADEFKDMVFIHPTLSENVWEALGEIGEFSIHI